MTTIPTPAPAPVSTGLSGRLAALRAALRAGRRRLSAYLTVTTMLVALTLVVLPETSAELPDPYANQRLEYIPIQGDGLLAPISRASLHATAWLAANTVDAQAALLRPTPLAARAGIPLTTALHRWQQRDLANLRLALVAVIAGLAAAVAFIGARRRTMVVVLVGMLMVSVLVTRPAQVLTAVGAPGRFLTASSLVMVAGPTSQRDLGNQYWDAYVTAPVSHATTGTAILNQAPPTARGGLLAALQRQAPRLGEGGAGSARAAVVGGFSLIPNAFVAVAAGTTAAAALIAQTLLFLLLLAGLLVGPLAVNRRRWPLLGRYWLSPMLGAAAITLVASFGSWVVTGAAVALAGTGQWLLSMLPGSALATLSVLLVCRWARRVRRRTHPDLAAPAQSSPATRVTPTGTGSDDGPGAGTSDAGEGKEAAA